MFLLAAFNLLLFFDVSLYHPYILFNFFSYFSSSCQFPLPADVELETLIVTSRLSRGLSSSVANDKGHEIPATKPPHL
jgi:hypothetical protein